MTSQKPIYVLGTGLSPHDGSTCLLKDGEIVVAIEKERLTRVKHDGLNDNSTVQYCLETEGIGVEDLSVIVQCGDSYLYLDEYHKTWDDGNGERDILDDAAKYDVPVVNVSHHLAHAYCGIGLAPFDDAMVFVIDGFGQSMKYCMDLEGTIFPKHVDDEFSHVFYEKDSFYEYSNGLVKTVFKDFTARRDMTYLSMFPVEVDHSIGEMYEEASAYCLGRGKGFNAGKLMGLAPYGDATVYSEEIFKFGGGRVFINEGWQRSFDKPCKDYNDFKQRFEYFANIANWIQRETERAMIYLFNERFKLCNHKNLIYSGGVALNAVVNAKILDKTPFENLFITPAAGDNGLAIGCAYYGWMEVLKRNRKSNTGNTFFGKSYSDAFIKHCIESYYVPGEVSERKILDTFFSSFPDFLKVNEVVSNRTINFIISNETQYNLRFFNGTCHLVDSAYENPWGTVSISSSDFIRWMNGSVRLSTLKLESKVHINGDISFLDSCFDFTEASRYLKTLLNPQMSNSDGVMYTREADIVSTSAKLLAEGNTIGWFQGGSEFGPRALGHRSILADPRRKDIKDFINSNVKFREDFRPFAPSVLLEDVSTYFHYEGESPYMLMITKVRSEWKDSIPGIVHEDNSARIQTVTEEWNEKYFHLLKKFKAYTGVSILLNTSFNRRKMPIVETPNDALNFFYECGLDYLVLGDYLIRKNTTLRP